MKGQLDEAKKQLVIMQEQAEAADRPWLKIIGGTPANDLTFAMLTEESFASATIIVSAKNIGKSVALNVIIRGKMTFTEGSGLLDREESALCASAAMTTPVPGVTVFPDENTKNSLYTMGVEHLSSKIENPSVVISDAPYFAPANSKLISPKFIGCVSYTYPSSTVIHHSDFRFALQYGEKFPKGAKPDLISAMLFKMNQPHFVNYFVVGKNISPKDLRIQPFYAGFDVN
jgi:hypothetical protein